MRYDAKQMAASNLVAVKSLLVQILRLAYLSLKKCPITKKVKGAPHLCNGSQFSPRWQYTSPTPLITNANSHKSITIDFEILCQKKKNAGRTKVAPHLCSGG